MRRHLAAALLAAVSLSACAGTSAGGRHRATSPTPHSTHSFSSSVTLATHPSGISVTTLLRLPVGVSRAVVVPQGTTLLVLGGLAAGDSTTARTWRVGLTTRSTQSLRPLAMAVHDASGALLGGKAYVFGGGAATTVAGVQQWTPGQARLVSRLPQARSDSASAVIGNTAYVVGGFTGNGMTRDVLSTSDGRSFHVVARLPIGVRYPAVTAVGTAVYVVGGALATTEGTANGAQTAAVQRVDPATGKASVIGHLPAPLAHAMAFSLGGALYVAGGRHGAVATAAIERVDLRTGRATRVGALPRAESDAGVAVTDGAAWLVGGETTGPGAPTNTVLRLRLQ